MMRMNAFRMSGLLLMVISLLLTVACEQKKTVDSGTSTVAVDEKQLESEYRSLLAETGLNQGGQAPAPGQLEQKQYEQVLFVAAGHASAELFTRLLNARSDVSLTESINGKTLLHAAAGKLHSHNTNLLLERGVDPNIQDSQGLTPLHLTVVPEAGVDLTRLLLSRGARVDAKDGQGMTPLMSAGQGVIKMLIDKGAGVAAQDAGGNTALHWAVTRKGHDQARLLIENGAPIDIQDAAGGTALHRAVAGGDLRMIQILLAAGAKTDIADKDGITALQMSQKSSSQIKALFVSR
jgi:ankyrin repeat protein